MTVTTKTDRAVVTGQAGPARVRAAAAGLPVSVAPLAAVAGRAQTATVAVRPDNGPGDLVAIVTVPGGATTAIDDANRMGRAAVALAVLVVVRPAIAVRSVAVEAGPILVSGTAGPAVARRSVAVAAALATAIGSRRAAVAKAPANGAVRAPSGTESVAVARSEAVGRAVGMARSEALVIAVVVRIEPPGRAVGTAQTVLLVIAVVVRIEPPGRAVGTAQTGVLVIAVVAQSGAPGRAVGTAQTVLLVIAVVVRIEALVADMALLRRIGGASTVQVSGREALVGPQATGRGSGLRTGAVETGRGMTAVLRMSAVARRSGVVVRATSGGSRAWLGRHGATTGCPIRRCPST